MPPPASIHFMPGFLSSRRGQTVVAEYVVALFLVVTAIGAMFIYVKRAFQAKARDAQQLAVTRASAALPGVAIPQQYEPYYAGTITNTDSYTRDATRIAAGGEFNKESTLDRGTESSSVQYPPRMAD